MIFAALLLMMQAGYAPENAPETQAVMDRSKREAETRRARQTQAERQSRQPEQGLPLPAGVAQKLQQCLDAAMADPAGGERFARQWALDGGSFSAAQCRGFALARTERWDAAIAAFEEASNEAQKVGAPDHAARLLAQAGNAALAAGDAAKARGYFDATFGYGLPDDLAKGELYLDRARALVALGDASGARVDIDQALKLAGDDPLAWLLSATLARRQNDLIRARKDIEEAKKRAGDDASVMLEDGNIAILAGDDAGAKQAWEQAIRLAPDSDQAKAAHASLDQLAAPDAAGNQGAKP